jgi:hypothetical protein
MTGLLWWLLLLCFGLELRDALPCDRLIDIGGGVELCQR